MKPILITLTAPSAAGKSHLLNYIRDVQGVACLTSTTTRAARAGEVHGRDYFFISHAKSLELESRGQFAELAEMGGTRYGVTHDEFDAKLATGLAVLIVEPSGIDHYVQPALDRGAQHLKFFVRTPLQTRLARLRHRVTADIMQHMHKESAGEAVGQVIAAYTTRLQGVFTQEQTWQGAAAWTAELDGTARPEENFKIIMSAVDAARKETA